MHWLLVKLSQVFDQLFLIVFSSLQSSLLLVHLFLPNFFFPVNFAFNTLWYSTLWTANPFSNDLLWLLCGGCQWLSSVPLPSQQSSTLLWFQRTRDTRNLYCRDGHSMKLKCKYSNILRYWITFYFHELYALIIENKKNIYIFKCFTLHVMNLEYMKVSLSTLSRYSNVLRCTCVYIYMYILVLSND